MKPEDVDLLFNELTEDQWKWTLTQNPINNPLLDLKSEDEYKAMCDAEIQCVDLVTGETRPSILAAHEEARRLFESTTRLPRGIVFNIYCELCGPSSIQFFIYISYGNSKEDGGLRVSMLDVGFFQEWVYECSVYTFYRFFVWNYITKRSIGLHNLSLDISSTPGCHLFRNIALATWYHVHVPKPVNISYNGDCSYRWNRSPLLTDMKREQCIEYLNFKKSFQSFLLHTHRRLGVDSLANVLFVDLLELIYKQGVMQPLT